MALHSFLSMQIGAPTPEDLAALYAGPGLEGHDPRWGSADCSGQIAMVEHPDRTLLMMRVGCDSESDLDAPRERLRALGIDSEQHAGRVVCLDTTGTWRIQVGVGEPLTLSTPRNRPGERDRSDGRAEVVMMPAPCPDLNHDSLEHDDEHDDVDAVGAAARRDLPDHDAWIPSTDWQLGRFSSWGRRKRLPGFIVPADIEDVAKAHHASMEAS